MADACCNVIIGGKVYITVGSSRWEVNGDVTIEPDDVAREPSMSAGGKLQVVERAMPQTATMDLSNFCKQDPKELWDLRCLVDVAVVEQSRKFVHFFSEAAIVGRRSLNLNTGVMSGLQIATDNYHVESLT